MRKAQFAIADIKHDSVPEVQRVPLLVEQDFGFYEGKRNIPRPDDSNKAGKQDPYKQHRHLPGFKEPETKAEMAKRADAFLDEHLLPLIVADHNEIMSIAIVSHGLTMPVLWRRLLQRLSPKSVSIAPEILATRQFYSIEHLGGWSNTGYLMFEMKPTEVTIDVVQPESATSTQAELDLVEVSAPSSALTVLPVKLSGWTLEVKAVNSTQHLEGLKRTGGGVGSARHDEGQKSIETFFKRRKIS